MGKELVERGGSGAQARRMGRCIVVVMWDGDGGLMNLGQGIKCIYGVRLLGWLGKMVAWMGG